VPQLIRNLPSFFKRMPKRIERRIVPSSERQLLNPPGSEYQRTAECIMG